MATNHSTPKPLPSQNLLRELLDYDTETGILKWRGRNPKHFTDGQKTASHQANAWNAQYAGCVAFTYISENGYHHGRFCDVGYRAHRIIWKWIYDEEPPQIDHLNGNRADNRSVNLAASDEVKNKKNQKLRADNKTGVCGVATRGKKWFAHIRTDGKTRGLGTYEVFEDAVAARKAASDALGFSERHGT